MSKDDELWTATLTEMREGEREHDWHQLIKGGEGNQIAAMVGSSAAAAPDS